MPAPPQGSHADLYVTFLLLHADFQGHGQLIIMAFTPQSHPMARCCAGTLPTEQT